MSKWPHSMSEWVHLILVLLSGIALLIIVGTLIQHVWLGSDYSQWDTLAFFGSIIGGLITWYGVRASIKINDRDRNERLLDEAAKKVRLTDNIILELRQSRDVFGVIEFQFDRERNDEYAETDLKIKMLKNEKDHAYLKIRNCVDNSVQIDAEAYKIMIYLESLAYQFNQRDNVFVVKYLTAAMSQGEVRDKIHGNLAFMRNTIEDTMEKIKEVRIKYLKKLFPGEDLSSFDLYY